MGYFTLEDIANQDSSESFATVLDGDVDKAVAVIYAAKDALATLTSKLPESFGAAPVEASDSLADDADDATVIDEAGSDLGFVTDEETREES